MPRSLSVFNLRNASISRGPWAARDISTRTGVLISLVFFAPVGSSSKKYWTSTLSTAAICTIGAALIRLVPASYFCTCWKLTRGPWQYHFELAWAPLSGDAPAASRQNVYVERSCCPWIWFDDRLGRF